MVWSGWQKWAATGFSVFLVLMSERCPFILACRAFSVSPTYCTPQLLACYKIDQIFVLYVLLLLMLYCLPVILLLNVLHVCYFLAAFTPFVVASVVAGVSWGGWCGQGRVDKEVPQILWPSKGYQRWVGDGLFQLL